MNIIQRATKIIGITRLAKACGVSLTAVQKWGLKGSLPRTEWTGETNYAGIIEKMSNGQVTKDELLKVTPGSANRIDFTDN